MNQPYRPPRILEILPGLFSITVITFPFWGAFFMPQIVAYFIIAFDVYWLYKSITLGIVATLSHYRMKASMANDWLKDLREKPHWEDINHLIIIPTYMEPIETLRISISYLAKQDYPLDKLHIILGCEEREVGIQAKFTLLEQEFGPVFGHFWATYHPDIPGEVKGKSSNEAYAAKWAKIKLVDELGLKLDYMTVTSMDADARFHEKYFSALAFEFIQAPNRYQLFFQPILLFYNNIWRVPAPIRVVNTFSNIFQTGKLAMPDRLVNNACYSASLRMIHDVGYWDVDVIPEDYRIFFKCFFYYNGSVHVAPIHLPISLDAAEGQTYWQSLVNQYQQIKRWAWGVSDDPVIIKWYLQSSKKNIFVKTSRVVQLLEEHFLWPVNWFILTIGATIPPLVNPQFKQTVLGQNLTTFPSAILSLTLITLIVVLIIDAKQRPPKPQEISTVRRWLMNTEFILMPLVGFFFSALPGLDAHTRLMFGKYMEYKVTEKVA